MGIPGKTSSGKTFHPRQMGAGAKSIPQKYSRFPQTSIYSPKFFRTTENFCFASEPQSILWKTTLLQLNLSNKMGLDTQSVSSNINGVLFGCLLTYTRTNRGKENFQNFMKICLLVCLNSTQQSIVTEPFQERVSDESDSVKWTEPSLQWGSVHVQVRVTYLKASWNSQKGAKGYDMLLVLFLEKVYDNSLASLTNFQKVIWGTRPD